MAVATLSYAWILSAAVATAQPALGAPTGEVQLDPLQFEGELDAVRQEKFTTAIRDELAETRRVVDQAEAGRYAVQGHVRAVERDFEIELRAVELQTNEVVASTRQLCELCGLAEAVSTAESLTATLAAKIDALASGPPTIRVTAVPVDAEIRIDGEVAGSSGLKRELSAGEHELSASSRGYVTEVRRVTSIAGTHEDVHFDLSKTPRRQPKTVAGWTLFGVGAASLVAGVTFIGIDNTQVRLLCSGDNIDVNGNCRFEHRTLGIGIGLASAGVTLVATGLALAVRKRRSKQRAAVRPTHAGLEWRF